MKDERCIEEEAGTPTLTVELENEARMLPWSAFISGAFDGKRISLSFTEWLIVVEGDRLEELWSSLQLQDVRLLRSLSDGDANECLIRSLKMQATTGV